MTDPFICPACGGPNEPVAGAAQMACTYCGANLTISTSMRRAAMPKVESIPARAVPASRLEEEAPEMLRKAQPILAQAWSTYAIWTWIRRVLPTCFVILLIGLCACGLLTVLPYFLRR